MQKLPLILSDRLETHNSVDNLRLFRSLLLVDPEHSLNLVSTLSFFQLQCKICSRQHPQNYDRIQFSCANLLRDMLTLINRALQKAIPSEAFCCSYFELQRSSQEQAGVCISYGGPFRTDIFLPEPVMSSYQSTTSLSHIQSQSQCFTKVAKTASYETLRV